MSSSLTTPATKKPCTITVTRFFCFLWKESNERHAERERVRRRPLPVAEEGSRSKRSARFVSSRMRRSQKPLSTRGRSHSSLTTPARNPSILVDGFFMLKYRQTLDFTGVLRNKQKSELTQKHRLFSNCKSLYFYHFIPNFHLVFHFISICVSIF